MPRSKALTNAALLVLCRRVDVAFREIVEAWHEAIPAMRRDYKAICSAGKRVQRTHTTLRFAAEDRGLAVGWMLNVNCAFN